ncbi:MAG TPA: hypothetical protein PK467_09935 [Candidatus Wallbacteria bacterium]|nr:hypothetical protein [Candidatus Wallbacteria bacterium]
MLNGSIIFEYIKQLYFFDIVILISISIVSIFFLMYFIVFIKKLLTIPVTVNKINNNVIEIVSRVTKIESDIKDLYRTASSIESLKGALVEIAEINKNTVSGSRQIIEQLININKNLEKIDGKNIKS